MVALHYGHPVIRIRLLPKDGLYYGECDTYAIADVLSAPGRERRSLARQVAVVTYAGMVAERDLVSIAVDPTETYEDRHVEALMKHARIGPRVPGYVGDDNWQAYKARLAAEAAQLVRQYRDAILRLAGALRERGELDRQEIGVVVGI